MAKITKRAAIALPKSKTESRPRFGRHEKRLITFLRSRPDESKSRKLFLGRAGEHFVAAQLMRRGLNASPLPVDIGVDLLAHHEMKLEALLHQAEHELYQFQVKTTGTSEYRASLPVDKVNELWHKVINLIVVFWAKPAAPVAVVLPPSLIRMLTSGGFEDPQSPLVMTGDVVSLRFIERDGRYYIRNYDNEITEMLNRFDRIEPIGHDTSIFPNYACWSDGEALVSIEPDCAD